jgi:predicted sugar kinase
VGTTWKDQSDSPTICSFDLPKELRLVVAIGRSERFLQESHDRRVLKDLSALSQNIKKLHQRDIDDPSMPCIVSASQCYQDLVACLSCYRTPVCTPIKML